MAGYAWQALDVVGLFLVQFNHKVTSLLWVWRSRLQLTQNLNVSPGSDKPWSPPISDGVPLQKVLFASATKIDLLSEWINCPQSDSNKLL